MIQEGLFNKLMQWAVIIAMIVLVIWSWPTINPGREYKYIGIMIFFLFTGLQMHQIHKFHSYSFKEVFSDPTIPLARRIALLIVYSIIFGAFLLAVVLPVAVYFADPAYCEPVLGTENVASIKNSVEDLGVIWFILTGIFAAFLIGMIVYTTLLLGTFTTGLSLSIAVHNYLNGDAFDLNALYDVVLDWSLTDLQSLLLTIAWFLLSIFGTLPGKSAPEVELADLS